MRRFFPFPQGVRKIQGWIRIDLRSIGMAKFSILLIILAEAELHVPYKVLHILALLHQVARRTNKLIKRMQLTTAGPAFSSVFSSPFRSLRLFLLASCHLLTCRQPLYLAFAT